VTAVPLFDLPLAELREHRCAAPPPADLDAFWQRALAEGRAAAWKPRLEP
jgi:cephalosporin-C deacetylase